MINDRELWLSGCGGNSAFVTFVYCCLILTGFGVNKVLFHDFFLKILINFVFVFRTG